MMSNCSLYRLRPLDPAIDPAYRDGPAPIPHRTRHAGEIPVAWPVGRIPESFGRLHAISIEALEDAIERQAAREERFS